MACLQTAATCGPRGLLGAGRNGTGPSLGVVLGAVCLVVVVWVVGVAGGAVFGEVVVDEVVVLGPVLPAGAGMVATLPGVVGPVAVDSLPLPQPAMSAPPAAAAASHVGRFRFIDRPSCQRASITSSGAIWRASASQTLHRRITRVRKPAEDYAPSVPNINDPLFDEPREHPGFRCRRARLSRQAASERLGLSLWELPPGHAAYPYHHHLGEEELIVVLAGRPTLRTPAGWRELGEGDVVAFLRGERGGHQVVNRTPQTVRFLAFSTSGDPDIVIYPDSAKVGAYERLPDGGGLRAMFRMDDTVDYHDGEQPPDG
jgi:uncharacterized cupin superfamily protein